MRIMLNDLEKAKGQALALDGPIDMAGVHYPDASFVDFSFSGQARKESGVVIVTGTISGTIKTRCSKCVTATEYTFTAPFEESFSETPVDEESDVHFYQAGKIELTPYFHEIILLEIPQTYLCGEECKGLCPTCGVSWNEQACSCNNERIDPRLADLALFFQKEQKE